MKMEMKILNQFQFHLFNTWAILKTAFFTFPWVHIHRIIILAEDFDTLSKLSLLSLNLSVQSQTVYCLLNSISTKAYGFIWITA